MKVISLGWGIQSWTMAAMSALGELEPVDVALNSDTTWESVKTYEFIDRWSNWLGERGVKVVVVGVEKQAAKVVSGEPDISAFTSKVPVVNAWDNPEIPAYHSYPNGKPSGMLHRQCTNRWKIEPMKKFLCDTIMASNLYWEDVARLAYGDVIDRSVYELVYQWSFDNRRMTKRAGCVEQWIGITVDEIERAKDSGVKWIKHRFPLLEKKMTRLDCILWLQSLGLPVPPKSACVFCPYHTRSAWAEMKREGGQDWETSVIVDESIRHKLPGYVAYVHPDRIPLKDIKISEDFGFTQGDMFDIKDAECDNGGCLL